MQQPNRCPLCAAETARSDAACPRCGYHADSYNRAQDDVALSFRLAISDPSRIKASTASGGTWLSAIPAWCKAHWPPMR
jgi:predicted amidophosphoribosyltransferase